MNLMQGIAKINDQTAEFFRNGGRHSSIEEAAYEPDRLLKLAGFPVVDLEWYTEASIKPMRAWCEENIGSMLYTHIHGSRWVFEHERDAIMFTLRWA